MSRWGPDLFASTAPYYARHRGYPPELFEVLARACALDGAGRLLDLATGTGQVAVPMARWFDEVVALDPDPDMLHEAERARDEAGARNVRFVRAHAEDLPMDLGVFRVVTIGSALHWMERERVLETVYDMLELTGVLAICGSGGEDESYASPDPRPVYGEVIKRYLGPERRAGSATYTHPVERHEQVIARTRFGAPETIRVPHEHEQTIDGIVGMLFSTSFANRRLLGEEADAFERDIRHALCELQPSGVFRLRTDYEIILARR